MCVCVCVCVHSCDSWGLSVCNTAVEQWICFGRKEKERERNWKMYTSVQLPFCFRLQVQELVNKPGLIPFPDYPLERHVPSSLSDADCKTRLWSLPYRDSKNRLLLIYRMRMAWVAFESVAQDAPLRSCLSSCVSFCASPLIPLRAVWRLVSLPRPATSQVSVWAFEHSCSSTVGFRTYIWSSGWSWSHAHSPVPAPRSSECSLTSRDGPWKWSRNSPSLWPLGTLGQPA